MLDHVTRAALAAAVIAAATPAQAATIDFDGLPYTTPGAVIGLDTQYAHLGILFENGVGSINTFGGVIILPTDPDGTNVGYMRLGAPQTFRFVDPTNPAVNATTDFVAFDNLGLIASGGQYSGFTARAFDMDGHLLGETTVAPVGPAQARSVFRTTLSFTGIHRITTARISSPDGGMQPIDNLTFGPLTILTPQGVPEPSTWAVMILGFAAAGHALRRARRRDRAVS